MKIDHLRAWQSLHRERAESEVSQKRRGGVGGGGGETFKDAVAGNDSERKCCDARLPTPLCIKMTIIDFVYGSTIKHSQGRGGSQVLKSGELRGKPGTNQASFSSGKLEGHLGMRHTHHSRRSPSACKSLPFGVRLSHRTNTQIL